MTSDEKKQLREHLQAGFSYYNTKTKTAIGGEDGKVKETTNVKRIKDLLKQ